MILSVVIIIVVIVVFIVSGNAACITALPGRIISDRHLVVSDQYGTRDIKDPAYGNFGRFGIVSKLNVISRNRDLLIRMLNHVFIDPTQRFFTDIRERLLNPEADIHANYILIRFWFFAKQH
ncbi:MAG: hypothetical protein IJN21_07010 [Clostridia bacterium]|nr:hypothetical protein [Clostridia bacterium]